MNSRLEDLAASISVVTKQQLLDTTATGINDGFMYESTTEDVYHVLVELPFISANERLLLHRWLSPVFFPPQRKRQLFAFRTDETLTRSAMTALLCTSATDWQETKFPVTRVIEIARGRSAPLTSARAA